MSATYQFGLYNYVLFGSTVIVLSTVPILWQRRHAVGATPLLLMQIAVALWCFFLGFEAAATTVPLRLLWGQLGYLGIATSAVFFYQFAREYGTQNKGIPRRHRLLLWIIPAITLGMAATSQWHHLLWTGITIDPATNLAVWGHGPWFWVFVAYNYAILTLGIVALVRALGRLSSFYQSQVLIILLAAALPVIGNILFVTNLNPLPGVDWTPIAFALTGLLLVWGLFRHQLFILVPVARKQLVESMMDGVLVVDGQSRIVDANPAAQALLGMPSLPIGELTEHVLREWSSSVTAPFEVIRDTPQGSKVLEIHDTPLTDERNDEIGRLITLRDITERKRAEDALHELNATLEAQVVTRTAEIRAEQEKSETILRNVHDAIALLDLELRFQYVNEMFTTQTGYTAQDVLGKYATASEIWAGTAQARDAIELAMARGDSWQGDITGQRKDGRTYHAAFSLAPVYDAQGNQAGYVTSQRDISRRKGLERARRQFIANISHAFRTPLTNIKLYTQVLRSGRSADRAEHYYQVLVEQISYLEHLVQDIVEMSILDAGDSVGAWRTVPVEQIVHSAVARYQERAVEAGLEVVIDLPDEPLPATSGDAARLAQALSEILENAILFTPTGGRVTVQCAAASNEGRHWVTVSVRDTGPGIPVEEQGRVFERFYRGTLAEAGHIPGSGLGLCIAHEILKAHGGQLTLDSDEGQGSVFCLWLPVTAPAE